MSSKKWRQLLRSIGKYCLVYWRLTGPSEHAIINASRRNHEREEIMQLVEQHRIDRYDPRWKPIDEATFKAKNLYNTALYVMRQTFIKHDGYIFPYAELDVLLRPTAQYQALPRKVAQQVLRQVCNAWEG